MVRFDNTWREQHPNQQPPYAILTIFTGDARTFADYDAAIEKLGHRDNHWLGKALPFPILLDPDAKTKKAWKPHWSETMLIFDPEGKLWGEGDLARQLSQIAAGELKPKPPTKLGKKQR